MFVKLSTFLCLMFLYTLTSCKEVSLRGKLRVRFTENGTYEIYKIASESPLQFVSEDSGSFNQDVELYPGSYLVLADCSSQIVNIYPGSSNVITAHKVNFLPLVPLEEGDKFSIQCMRSERTHSRQHLTNNFSLAILEGNRDLLVGMVPLQLNLVSKEPVESRVISYVLSTATVSESKSSLEKGDFFVSPTAQVAPYTESQKTGRRLLLLKGKYEIQLNGTSTTIDLAEGESRTIVPATLTVEVGNHVNLDQAAKIKGDPLYVELNGEHYLHLNTRYPILPGVINLRLSSSFRPRQISASEGENIILHAKNVMVSLGCADADWTCLGSRKVRLYEKGKSFPFAESVTDVPVVYLEDHVAIGIEGSRNIKYELPPVDDVRLRIGFVEITPTPTHRPGMLTDLARLEPTQSPLVGFGLDLPLDKPTSMPLISGHYQLAQYTFFTSDGSRRKSSYSFYVSVGDHLKIPMTTFLSEKRMTLIDPKFVDSESKKSPL